MKGFLAREPPSEFHHLWPCSFGRTLKVDAPFYFISKLTHFMFIRKDGAVLPPSFYPITSFVINTLLRFKYYPSMSMGFRSISEWRFAFAWSNA
ncbi:hypothetical protein Tsubulata_030072 [Turnera subulata]|uniref:Uncharacterized protein n=1 Tax=Turnera subulata TaxID=218843 RepID=A0A9Q0JBJ3_9ROSI|nr:hypothetical protein Tsubulata_030072 [Turnera subulata]